MVAAVLAAEHTFAVVDSVEHIVAAEDRAVEHIALMVAVESAVDTVVVARPVVVAIETTAIALDFLAFQQVGRLLRYKAET